MFSTAAIYIGLGALLILLLSANVSRLRVKHQAPHGDGGPSGDIKELRRAVRAHGNCIENLPFLLLMLAAMDANGVGSVLVHVFGSVLVLSRTGHATAALRGGLFAMRAASVLATWALYLVGGVLLIAHVV